jgi:hypothetical protein
MNHEEESIDNVPRGLTLPFFLVSGSRPSASPGLGELIRFLFFILLIIATIGLILLVLKRNKEKESRTQCNDDDTRIYDTRG